MKKASYDKTLMHVNWNLNTFSGLTYIIDYLYENKINIKGIFIYSRDEIPHY